MSDKPPREAPKDSAPKPLQNTTEPAPQELTPELLDWMRRHVNEEEIIAGLHEIRETGGQELKDFIREIEREAGITE